MGSTVIKALFAMLVISYTWLFQEQNQEWDRIRQLLKSANNFATHDAVQLARKDTVNDGMVIVMEEAHDQFLETLQLNLGLDGNMQPKSGSPLQNEVRLVYFEVVDETTSNFPFLYEKPEYRIAKFLNGPAVIAVIETDHPALMRNLMVQQPVRVAAIHEKKINIE